MIVKTPVPITPLQKGLTRSRPITSRGRARYERMIDAAEILFSERPYGEISINEIVKRSGGSLANVYKWFGGKDELLLAMIKRRILKAKQSIEAMNLQNKSLEVALEQLIDSLTNFAPTQLVRSVLCHSQIFSGHSVEIGQFFDANLLAPLISTIEGLKTAHRIEFFLDSTELVRLIIRYIRGVMIEKTLSDTNEGDLFIQARESLKVVIRTLIRPKANKTFRAKCAGQHYARKK